VKVSLSGRKIGLVGLICLGVGENSLALEEKVPAHQSIAHSSAGGNVHSLKHAVLRRAVRGDGPNLSGSRHPFNFAVALCIVDERWQGERT
jgi:hypothetical protein